MVLKTKPSQILNVDHGKFSFVAEHSGKQNDRGEKLAHSRPCKRNHKRLCGRKETRRVRKRSNKDGNLGHEQVGVRRKSKRRKKVAGLEDGLENVLG